LEHAPGLSCSFSEGIAVTPILRMPADFLDLDPAGREEFYERNPTYSVAKHPEPIVPLRKVVVLGASAARSAATLSLNASSAKLANPQEPWHRGASASWCVRDHSRNL